MLTNSPEHSPNPFSKSRLEAADYLAPALAFILGTYAISTDLYRVLSQPGAPFHSSANDTQKDEVTTHPDPAHQNPSVVLREDNTSGSLSSNRP